MYKSKAARARNLRYKRAALSTIGYDAITSELYDINEACSDIQWFADDEETLLNALDGDEDEGHEFKMAFSDLSAKAEQLENAIRDWDIRDEFDDCTVGLIGNRYRAVGYDSYEEDYYALCGYEEELAQTESGKRLMRHTKQEMISIIGQSVGILVAFLALRQQYDYLKATFDILRDENTSVLKTIKEIQVAYAVASDDDFCQYREPTKHFDRLLDSLPQRTWLE